MSTLGISKVPSGWVCRRCSSQSSPSRPSCTTVVRKVTVEDTPDQLAVGVAHLGDAADGGLFEADRNEGVSPWKRMVAWPMAPTAPLNAKIDVAAGRQVGQNEAALDVGDGFFPPVLAAGAEMDGGARHRCAVDAEHLAGEAAGHAFDENQVAGGGRAVAVDHHRGRGLYVAADVGGEHRAAAGENAVEPVEAGAIGQGVEQAAGDQTTAPTTGWSPVMVRRITWPSTAPRSLRKTSRTSLTVSAARSK